MNTTKIYKALRTRIRRLTFTATLILKFLLKKHLLCIYRLMILVSWYTSFLNG